MDNQQFSLDKDEISHEIDSEKKLKLNKSGHSLSEFVKRKLLKHWTDQDVKLLIQLYPEHSNQYISQILNKTKSSIDSKSFYLGLKKNPVYRRRVGRLNNQGKKQAWKENDVQFLIENYQSQKYGDVANEIKRTPNAVSQKARQLKLRKYARYTRYVDKNNSDC